MTDGFSPMRKQPVHNSIGFVKWPDPKDGWRDDGQGGMAVYALVKHPDWNVRDGLGWNIDQWVLRCPRATLDHNLLDVDWDTVEEGALAVVPLGVSNYSWWHYEDPTNGLSDGYPFRVTRNDLTSKGMVLVATLEALYGLPVVLATHIDT